jgi:hypothetical protein
MIARGCATRFYLTRLQLNLGVRWRRTIVDGLEVMFRRRSCLTFVLLGALACRVSAAQRPRADTLLVRAVMEATVAGIGPELAEFVFRPRPEVWQFAPPDTADPLWISAFRGLGELLHAQPPHPDSDREYHYLEMRERAGGDSIRTFNVAIGYRSRCARPGRWVGASRSFTVRLARLGRGWQVLPAEPWIDALPGIC